MLSRIFKQQGGIDCVILLEDILDLISGENTKMISVSHQSNPCELSLVTDRAALYSARPVCADDNQKESSDHLEFSGVLPPPLSPPPPPHPNQARSVPPPLQVASYLKITTTNKYWK